MKLAVFFAKDKENPYGLPAEWPCACCEIRDEKEVPQGAHVMTVDEYEAHKNAHMREYQEWEKKIKYKSEYKDLREKEYPSDKEILRAMLKSFSMMLEIPEPVAAILKKIKEVNEKYPDPK